MRVILCEFTHAKQPVQNPAFFVAMHHAILKILYR